MRRGVIIEARGRRDVELVYVVRGKKESSDLR
jgi:hypothetical protein